ncbi:ABC transporter ATP-binding protein [Kribbella solani]|uniref:ABC transporter ATP-binding protein n=1 Tax=Kribbella solani TaxID=236067 RepID=UPI0029B1682D|nr:ABC transporter ATP-binding protein [Kribbella solani]MDX3001830.1 ABC transporter ATP-binding protein [Kribbella solani]
MTVLLEAVEVTKRMALHGRQHGQWFTAVDSASMTLESGKVVALVGESGSGKSTLARILTLGDEPSGGTIRLAGKNVSYKRRTDRQAHFGQVQLIMQDPFASLNQLHRVRYILSRPLRNFGTADGDLTAKVIELLERVNLTPGEQYIDKYPHELSGGQRQRVAIARALAADPVVLIGDEPVSMLDVSIRLDVLRLFADLCARDGLAMLYITHDIASARYFADEINVIYAARMVEGGPAEEVTQRPRHPYTQLLLESSPDPDRGSPRRTLPMADASNESADREQELAGCPFAARCPHAMPICAEKPPPTATFADGHWSRCWLHEE